MNTIRLYAFKDSFSRKIQFLSAEYNLDIIDDPLRTSILDIEIITEYIINIPNNLAYEDLSHKELSDLCSYAKQTTEHYFIKNNND